MLGRRLLRATRLRRWMSSGVGQVSMADRMWKAVNVVGLDGGEKVEGVRRDIGVVPPVHSEEEDATLLYWSPESRMVRALSVLLTVKISGALGLAAWWGVEEVGKLRTLLDAWGDSGQEFASFVEATILPLPLFSPAFGLALLGYLGLWQVRKGTTRVVRELWRVQGKGVDGERVGSDRVVIRSMGVLWGMRETVKDRSDVECATANKLTPHFVTLPEGGWWLLPVEGWYSQDLEQLKTLLWWRYFRENEPKPVPEEDLIAIEGFGPFRPAALADPSHPAHKAMPFPATPDDVKDTALSVLPDGNVYAHFPPSPPRSLDSKRRKEAFAIVHGDDVATAVLQHHHPTSTLGSASRTTNPDGSISVSFKLNPSTKEK